MKVWRLSAQKYEKTAFSGIGAARNPGRWNMREGHVVYCSENLAVAMIERLVYILDEPKKPYVYFEVNLPDELVSFLDAADLPPNWDEYPHPESTQQIGNAWLVNKISVALRVPSVVVPEAFNYLFNPDHEDFSRVSWSKPKLLTHDKRLDDLVDLAKTQKTKSPKG
jgi:RES domain-containing protein